MKPSPFQWSPVSRRRALVLAGGAAALAATAPARRIAAQVTPIASPVPAPTTAGTPIAGASAPSPHPLSSTLAADASPEFRTAVEALMAAMQQVQVPGAAIGLLAGDREEHATVGLASLSSLRPVTPETLFQIGSLTKTYSRYADLSHVVTFALQGSGLEGSTELIDQPGSWQPAIRPPAAPTGGGDLPG